MASYVKYDTFVENLCDGLIDLIGVSGPAADAADTVKAVIHTDPPVNSSVSPDTNVANLQQISGTNGYTTDGTAVTYTCARTASTGIMVFAPSADITWTASGGNLGGSTTGRYFSLYDDTAAGNWLICSFDYAATFTVAAGETMTLDFGTTLFTLT